MYCDLLLLVLFPKSGNYNSMRVAWALTKCQRVLHLTTPSRASINFRSRPLAGEIEEGGAGSAACSCALEL